MEKKTQRSEVLKYMLDGNSITSMEAFEKFGATRLSAIVFDFRKAGYNINTIRCVGKNRYGAEVHYAKYVLIKED